MYENGGFSGRCDDFINEIGKDHKAFGNPVNEDAGDPNGKKRLFANIEHSAFKLLNCSSAEIYE